VSAGSPATARRSVAIVGAGVSGLTAAYLLARTNSVTLYEADDRLGGHAHTQQVVDAAGTSLAIDTGFIVHNDRTYPQLRRMFAELGVLAQPTEMSMSIRDESSGLEYAGGKGLGGILSQPRRALDPRFLGLLKQVNRFHRRAGAFLERTDDLDATTYGEFLHAEGFSDGFIALYAIPVVSCVWSMGSDTALGYPARYLFQFLAHHGLLSVAGSPQWYTVVGGSRTYVDAIATRLPQIRAGRAVDTVLREDDGVTIVDGAGRRDRHDAVVIATHADQALRLLGDATPDEKELLGAFRYSRSEAVLHSDASLLPTAPRARASWNYLVSGDSGAAQAPVVSYWMNRLQNLQSQQQYLVTLNATDRVDAGKIISVMQYEHPQYDVAAIRAQGKLSTLTTDRTVYAGAYHGWGFHEDGCRSGVVAAQALGVTW
jgi:predicted NAD/FAD-binding protein